MSTKADSKKRRILVVASFIALCSCALVYQNCTGTRYLDVETSASASDAYSGLTTTLSMSGSSAASSLSQMATSGDAFIYFSSAPQDMGPLSVIDTVQLAALSAQSPIAGITQMCAY